MVVMSDFNGPYGSTTYRETVHEGVRLVVEVLRPEVVLSAGDLVAGQKRGLTEEQIAAMWAGFEAAVVRPLREAGIPFLPVAGNHDASGYPAFAAEREAYVRQFREATTRPAVKLVDDADYPLSYTAVYKGVGILVMDLTTIERLPERQWEQIGRQLKGLGEATDRVAVSHVPPYPVTHGRERETVPHPDDDRLVDLLAGAGVSAWFTGHHHGYYKGRAGGVGREERARGLMLVSLNCCGDGPRRLIGTAEPQPQSVVVVDVVEGKVARVFAVTTEGKVVDETRLPETLVHGNEELLRWDVPATRPVMSEQEERRP
jgi:Icc-related predicted phosphoesterase